jgi:Calcineurin-like phosphoesterase
MGQTIRLGILSDIHYASRAEQARGENFEFAGIPNPVLRLFVRTYRHQFWMRAPMSHNDLLDRFLAQANGCDYVIANGDYSCNSAFVGVSDEAAFQSVREALGKLHQRFGDRLRVNFGDHELGKVSFFGGHGGMRLASLRRAQEELGFKTFWQLTVGTYALVGVASSLVALPVFEPDTLPEERAGWKRAREEHLEEIRQFFSSLKPDQRVLLFCHDPSALPFLWQEPLIRPRVTQIEQTIIGHLHSKLILWKSRWLTGMPRVRFLGHTAKRLSAALRQARHWRPFKVRLCPSLAGIELLKDGGYLTADLDPAAQQPARFKFHHLPR